MRRTRLEASSTGRSSLKPDVDTLLERLRQGWPTPALVLLTLAVYWRAGANDFVDYDDGLYVFNNTHVRDGFSVAGLRYAFTTGETGTWQPLVLLSHMLDAQLYGLDPRGHHLTNVFLHAANALLLLVVLNRLTGNYYASWFVAAVFALHPAHVESVAWVSERKDVLSTVFWMLTMLAYARYARRPGPANYALVFGALALGLMAKPMLVTLPCVLLLLDYWPLRRFEGSADPAWRRAIHLFIEKLPLFALSAASSAVTLYVQSSTQTVVSLENLPLAARLSNVVVSLARYLGKMLWPVNLAVHYPHPKDTLPMGLVAACAALLLFITVAAVVLRKRAPYGLVGWLWYLVTVSPVIGLIQVGTQGMADRYTYVPMIGCSILVAWGVPDLLALPRRVGLAAPRRAVRDALWASVVVLVCAMSILTFRQIGVWKDTETLWRHAVRVTKNNDIACRNLAMFEIEKGRFDAAVSLLETAVRVNPADEGAYYFLGLACHRLGRLDSAESYYRQALRLDPGNIDTMNGLGLALLGNRSFERAIEILRAAHEADPARADSIANYGAALCAAGRHEEAVSLLESGVKAHPDNPVLSNVLAIALHGVGRTRDAVEQVRKALELRPDYVEAQRNLEFLESQLGPPDV